MRVKGLLFDKDGTLTDFHATWMPAYNAAAALVEEWAQRPELADTLLSISGLDPLTGRCAPSSPLACGTTAEIAAIWSQAAGVELGKVAQGLERMFEEYAAARAVPVTDLPRLFGRLKARKLVLGLATMDSETLAHATLERLELQGFMSFVCGYDSGYGEKPGRGMVDAFCASTGLSASDVGVVGDTPHDLNMARAAGAGLVIGVLSGASPRESLVELADHVLTDIAELESVLSD